MLDATEFNRIKNIPRNYEIRLDEHSSQSYICATFIVTTSIQQTFPPNRKSGVPRDEPNLSTQDPSDTSWKTAI
ncbi:hypothetical protein Pst134EA_005571 [Puccinia striiformis f. sp. tritici]|uniref:hypothetical protein n=1 Tax=Puccinia striiformis f. sp. tritici TaxID=168172 RepID=UPI0020081D35|nr:hypothetical protein Pst134EA_005571 [Puccinia striiformis f. sp. tritici]KAH9471692.1 hypothetical protein Pst134EA_005571 [Puccinia striiformis f. sp. tritici]